MPLSQLSGIRRGRFRGWVKGRRRQAERRPVEQADARELGRETGELLPREPLSRGHPALKVSGVLRSGRLRAGQVAHARA